jgi:glycosyltransferase involved in cell wall biosynthesis
MTGAKKDRAFSTLEGGGRRSTSTYGESIMAEQRHTPLISLVVPFYNEGEAIDRFFAGVMPVLETIDGIRFEIVCVNDGSEDDTIDQLVSFSVRDPRVRVIDLARNFGKEAALTAGLDEANGDAIIPIDADLQDASSLIPAIVEGAREVRCAGHAKVSGWKLWNFALKGATSFSTVLLPSWTYVGLTIAASAFLYAGFIVGRMMVDGSLAPGYASVISTVLVIGGISLIGIGVVRECIGGVNESQDSLT